MISICDKYETKYLLKRKKNKKKIRTVFFWKPLEKLSSKYF